MTCSNVLVNQEGVIKIGMHRYGLYRLTLTREDSQSRMLQGRILRRSA